MLDAIYVYVNDDSVLLKEQCGCERYFMNYDM